jgi:hypothetical protein
MSMLLTSKVETLPFPKVCNKFTVKIFGGLHGELVWNSDGEIVAAEAVAEAEDDMMLMLPQW